MLGGNQWKADSQRFEWKVEGRGHQGRVEHIHNDDDRAIPAVVLRPMEIRTFILTLVPN